MLYGYMVDKIDRWLDEHCLDCHHISSCYFQPKDKEMVRGEKNKGKMGGKKIKWDLREKRRKEREMSGQVMHGKRVGKGKGEG